MAILNTSTDKTASKDLRSDIIEWYIDDDRYLNTPMPSRNPINIRWLAGKVSKLPSAKEMLNKAFEDIKMKYIFAYNSDKDLEKYRNEYANKYAEKGIETLYIDTRYILK
jgi:hypothetical protein